MGRTFDIRYRWTLEDYVVLSKRYTTLTRGRRIARIIHFVVDTALLATAFYFWSVGERGLAAYFMALFVFLLLLALVVLPWQRRRGFAHQRLGEFELEFHADETGFTTSSELASGTHKWAAIRQVDDLPGHVLLWPSNRMGWMIPKRAFASPGDAAAFVQLAREKTDGQTL